MTMFRQVVLNGMRLKEIPFQRESELQGYLCAHPELLSLVERNDDFKVGGLIGVERKLKDGRVDMVVEYRAGQIAIVELKRGVVNKDDYDQLKGYLDDVQKIAEEWKVFQDYKRRYKDFDERVRDDNVFGLLVGRMFSSEVEDLLKKPARKRPIINGLSIKRYRADGNEYLMTETFSNFSTKDYQKYLVEGEGPFGKGRMVLAAIKAFVSKHKSISYDDLVSEECFPVKLRGPKREWGCVSLFKDASRLAEQTGNRRHFLDAEDVIILKDGVKAAVSSQWGIGNVDGFIRRAKKLGVKIENVKTGRIG